MQQGLYVVFEGIDGSGKSSTMKIVGDELSDKLQIKLAHQPGSTPLGEHLRQLVKYPEKIDPNIEIDDFSRQLLYLVDAAHFIRSVLNPNLQSGKTVFSDRSSFISSIVYGLADDLDLEEIRRLFQIAEPPKIDRLYILQCPGSTSKERLQANRDGNDHYDVKPLEFFQKLQNIYDNLLTGSAEQLMLLSNLVSLDNVVYIDANQPQEHVVRDIVKDLERIVNVRFGV